MRKDILLKYQEMNWTKMVYKGELFVLIKTQIFRISSYIKFHRFLKTSTKYWVDLLGYICYTELQDIYG